MPLLSIFILLLITVIQLGCQTTGDPNAGGLFGWSETKANQRQGTLESRAGQAQQNANMEQNITRDYRRNEGQLQQEVAMMGKRLERLVDENNQLQAQLTDLQENRKISSGQLDDILAELESLQPGGNLHEEYSQRGSIDQQKSFLDSIERANQKYTDAILFLLKY